MAPRLTLGFQREARELPEVRFVHRWSAPFGKEMGSALERSPIGLDGRTRTEVWAGDVQNLPMGKVIRDKDALMRVIDHEDQTAQYRCGDLKGRRVLSPDQTPCLVDIEL